MGQLDTPEENPVAEFSWWRSSWLWLQLQVFCMGANWTLNMRTYFGLNSVKQEKKAKETTYKKFKASAVQGTQVAWFERRYTYKKTALVFYTKECDLKINQSLGYSFKLWTINCSDCIFTFSLLYLIIKFSSVNHVSNQVSNMMIVNYTHMAGPY